MEMESERAKLCCEHRRLRVQWGDVYDDFTGRSVGGGMLPFHLSRRLFTIGERMRQIEAELGEGVPA